MTRQTARTRQQKTRTALSLRGLVFALVLLACPSPVTAQEISANFGQGSVRVGYDSLSCDGPREGAIRFNSGNDLWQYCHSNSWVSFSSTSNLSALTDVNLSAPQADEVLLYNSASQEWENGALGASSTLDSLSDVSLSAPVDEYVLKYVSTSGEWVNAPLALQELQTVNITSPQDQQYLLYNGASWVNQYATMPIMSDTSIGGPSNGQLLIYYSGRWRNRDDNFANTSDINLSSPSNGEVLRYNGSYWTDGPPSSGTLAAQSDTNISAPSYFQVLLHNGTSWVNGTPVTSWALNDVTDVTISSPANGQSLKHNGSIWVNADLALSHLGDVNIGGLSTGHVLIYDGSEWDNRALAFMYLDDISISSPTSGQSLVFNGSDWVNVTLPLPLLSDLTDVTVSGPLESEVLRYDADTAQWVNGIAITGAAPPISPHKKFDANAAAPITCNGTNAGAFAVNSGGKVCACDGTGWIFDDGTACSW